MKHKQPVRPNSGQVEHRLTRSLVFIGVSIVVIAAVAVLVRSWLSRSEAKNVIAAAVAERGQSPVPILDNGNGTAPHSDGKTADSLPASSGLPPQVASQRSRDLVSSLCQSAPSGSTLSPEMAAAWRGRMQQTIELGSEAVPAIREFLRKNVDYDLGAGAQTILGYASARAAMFDVLLQIGGGEAEAVLLEALTSALDPKEIALLARNLNTMAPEQHSDAIVATARRALGAGARGDLADRDVAPAFEVLNRFGGAEAAPVFEQAAGQWAYYAAIALAQMPEGAGVSTLIRLAEGTGALSPQASDPAIRILAGLTAESEEARAALLDLAQRGRVSADTWPALIPGLAGDRERFVDGVLGELPPTEPTAEVRRTHLAHGNQNFWSAPPAGGIALDQLTRQLNWLDGLATSIPAPAAQDALRRARELIEQRLQAATPPP